MIKQEEKSQKTISVKRGNYHIYENKILIHKRDLWQIWQKVKKIKRWLFYVWLFVCRSLLYLIKLLIIKLLNQVISKSAYL